MDKPTITIDGKTYELPRPKCGAWRKLTEFEKNHSEISSEDYVEARCEFLADIYGGGLTADDLLYNLYLDEVMQAYRDVGSYIIGRLTAKLEQAEKNVETGVKQAQ